MMLPIIGNEMPQEMMSLDSHYTNVQMNQTYSLYYAENRPERSGVPSKEFLNARANEIRISISESGRYVIWNDIISELLKKYNVNQIGQLGLKYANELDSINNLIKLQNSINAFVACSERLLSFITLFELENMIARNCERKAFSELYVGPLYKNEVVQKIFNLPPDFQVILQITFGDLFTKLEKYLTEFRLWDKKVDKEKFIEYMMKEYDVDNKEKLGIKIVSIGLLIGTVKSCRRLHKEAKDYSLYTIETEIKRECDKHVTWLKTNLENKLSSLFNSLSIDKEFGNHATLYTRHGYVTTDCVQIIDSLMQEFLTIAVDKQDTITIINFLKRIKNNTTERGLFHLGICFSNLNLNRCLENFKSIASKISFDKSSGFYIFLRNYFETFIIGKLDRVQIEEVMNRIFTGKGLKITITDLSTSSYEIKTVGQQHFGTSDCQSKDVIDPYEMANEIKETFNLFKRSSKTALSLIDLAKIEEKIILKYKCDSFMDISKTSFLKFITEKQFQSYFEQEGFNVLYNNYHKKELIEHKKFFLLHLKQLYTNYKLEANEEHFNLIETIMLKYYLVPRIVDLGFGGYKNLLEEVSTEIKKTNEENLNTIELNDDKSIMFAKNIIYEDSLLDENVNNIYTVNKNREDMVKVLSACPILENVVEYSRWNIFFQKTFGNIKEFILFLNKSNIINIYVLETEPGVMLKLTPDASLDKIKEFISQEDFRNAAGHILSLIVLKYGSIKSADLNHIQYVLQDSFLNLYNKYSKDNFEESDDEFSYFYSFIIDLIYCLPIKFASNCISSLIFNTIEKIEGNVKNVKEKIFKQYLLYEDEAKIQYFRDLGILCQIKEWFIEFESSCERKLGNKEVLKYRTYYNSNEVRAVVSKNDTENKEVEEQLKDSNMNESEQVVKYEKENMKDLNPTIPEIDCKLIDDCKSHVERIRRERYGVDLELTENVKKISDHLKGLVGRSLERLSTDLYNEDIHFVLELIQNADDNHYDEGVEPTLIFLIESDAVTTFNNESGFSEANINAICDIGGSTKADRQGYIGRKGIGFKSVYTITNCPQIHSNGYHIKFDVSNDNSIGYILPLWCTVEEIARKNEITKTIIEKLQALKKRKIVCSDIKTTICLPLIRAEIGMEKQKYRSITASFSDIEASLLLFLNKLKNLIIFKVTSNEELKEFIYKRYDHSANLIELESPKEKSFWIMASISLKVPEDFKSKENIDVTKLCLSFPIADGSNYNTRKALPHREVFAYLPIKSYGFKFIIQGDFEVTASRQDLHHDNCWNQMLVNKIPQLFLDAFDLFRDCKSFSNLFDSIKSYLKFFPLEDDISDTFFKKVAKQILLLLKNKEFLPVSIPNEDETNTETILLKKPGECYFVTDSSIRDVLKPEMLSQCVSSYYLHPLFYSEDIDLRILYQLGVRNLTIKEIIEISKTIFQSTEINDLKYIAKWLLVLKRCLNSSSDDEIFEKLKRIPFIPLKSGKNVKLDETIVFFPKEMSKRPMYEINVINKLNLIDINQLCCFDSLSNKSIIAFLENLGVKHINEKDVIEYHIFLKFQEGKIENDISVDYLIYIFNYWNQDRSFSLSQKSSSILIQTNKGLKNPKSDQIYLSNEYNIEYDLKKMFPKYDWCFVNNVYLTRGKIYADNTQNVKIWFEFLVKLGALNIFMPELKRSVYSADQIKNSNYSLYSQLLPTIKNNQVFICNDFICPVFDFYLKKKDDETDNNFFEVFKNFYFIFENNWTTSFCHFKFVNVSIGNEDDETGKLLKGIFLGETEFYKKLRDYKWMFGTRYINGSKYGEFYDYFKPDELHVNSDKLKKFYGLNVSYLECPKTKTQNIILEFKLKNIFEFDEFFNVYQCWCKTNDNNKVIIGKKQISCIYRSFQYQAESNPDLLPVLLNNRSIFFPQEKLTFDNQIDDYYIGIFYNPNQVYIHDPTGFFKKYDSETKPLLLDEFYDIPTLSTFFLQVSICNNPPIEMYLELIQNIQLSIVSDAKFEDTASDALTIILFILNQIERDPVYQSVVYQYASYKDFLTAILSDKAIWPCTNKKWVSLNDHPLLIDDIELGTLFENSLNCVFIPPNKRSSKHEEMMLKQMIQNKIGLEYISNVIVLDSKPFYENLYPQSKVQNICRKYLFYLQCFLSNNTEFKNTYRKCVEDKYHELFKKMNFFSVRNLEIKYFCTFDQSINVGETKQSVVEKNKKTGNLIYYLHPDIVEKEKEVLVGFIDCFFIQDTSLRKELVKFTKLIYPFVSMDKKLTAHEKNEIETDHGIKLELGVNEIEWVIDEAKIELPKQNKANLIQEEDEEEKLKEKTSAGYSIKELLKIGQHQQLIKQQLNSKEYTVEDFNTIAQEDVWVKREKDTRLNDTIDVDTPPLYPTDVVIQPNNSIGSLTDDFFDNRPTDNQKTILNKVLLEDKSQLVSSIEHDKIKRLDGQPKEKGPNYSSSILKTHHVNSYHTIKVPPNFKFQEIEETLFDEINIINVEWSEKVKTSLIINDKSDITSEIEKQIGMYGEIWVYEYLKNHYMKEVQEGKIEIIWINGDTETYEPFDIKVINKEANETHYIEVKSTHSSNKECFPISLNQLIFAQSNPNCFYIYRLYNVGCGDPNRVRCKLVRNVSNKLHSHDLQIYLLI